MRNLIEVDSVQDVSCMFSRSHAKATRLLLATGFWKQREAKFWLGWEKITLRLLMFLVITIR
ncbi:hypothetical protein HYPSUDRAFT_37287 [Hypholoma sublateritium FD-334 SS-4]|uniref:Uncharacterized protein n=1 Tax=Hypholoma sublateritium (strain FD-334 SS-4) TaxID=945553 RepID=A0A0D2MPF6_HYPSF|nr:hypothetical protein HYPSUDRAFT_37287 [Hypholoma sublateritium FD-334 SS-4]